jgi:hypothetical protein
VAIVGWCIYLFPQITLIFAELQFHLPFYIFHTELISPDGSDIPFGRGKVVLRYKFPKGFSVQQDRTQPISTVIALQKKCEEICIKKYLMNRLSVRFFFNG